MKNIFLLLLLLATTSMFCQNVSVVNQQAEDFYNKAMPVLRPGLKSLVQSKAYQLKGHTVNVDSLTASLKNNNQLTH